MKTRFYSRLLLLLIAIVSIPISSCTDQKQEEFKEIESAISYKRALTPEDMTNALKAARKIEYYSYTTPSNPVPYPKQVEQVMLDYLAEQGGIGIKSDYAQFMNSGPMKTAEAYFAHELYSNARIEAGDLALANQMMNQAGLSTNAKAVMNKMYYDLEASGEILLLEAEANAALGSSTSTSEIKSRFRKLLLPYRDKIYSNPTLSTKDKQLIHDMAVYVLDQLNENIDYVRDQVLAQAANGRWSPKTIFGKILRAAVNTVVAVTVCTVLGALGAPVNAPNAPSGLSGVDGGFLAGVAWSVYMIATGEYWI